MRHLRSRLVLLAAIASLVLPAVALARAISWGGNGHNGLGPASVLLSVANGRAKVTNVQLIMECTDANDGTVSPSAFFAHYRTAEALRSNHYAFDFTASSQGRVGRVRMDGVLRSNGTGTARVRVHAVGFGEHNEVVDRCDGTVHLALRRGN